MHVLMDTGLLHTGITVGSVHDEAGSMRYGGRLQWVDVFLYWW